MYFKNFKTQYVLKIFKVIYKNKLKNCIYAIFKHKIVKFRIL